jgi:hypothetical protein
MVCWENTSKGKAISEQALGVPEALGSQISRQLAHEVGKVVTSRLHTQEIFLVLISVIG